CFCYPYRVVFVSDATRESCVPLDVHHNFITINNGLDRAKFIATLREWPRELARWRLGVDQNEIMILIVGTVCERNGQIDLVEAIGQLDEQQARTIRCFIVGDRPSNYSARLQAIHQALPGSKRSRIEI